MSLWKKVNSLLATDKERILEEKLEIKDTEREPDPLPADGHTKIFIPDKQAATAKQALPAVLKVISGINSGTWVSIGGARVNIGRAAGNELELTDPGISRLHAFIANEDGHHVLYDGRSMNGTYVNGLRVTKKTLQHGDAIKIANTVVLYELE